MRKGFWSSSVGTKFIVAGTGLLLFGFVLAHMLGNLQIFMGRDAINDYAKHLQELPFLLWPARVILLGSLLLHMVTAMRLSILNRKARPAGYALKKSAASTLPSRKMLLSGAAVFLFIVYHLLHFTFGATHPDLATLLDPKGRHDVYTMVVASFRDPWIAASYVLAMFFLCAHLSHGIGSVFQSLGASDDRQRVLGRILAWTISGIIFIGNTSIVAACFFGFLKLPARGL